MAELERLLAVLRDAPPKQMVTDQRYWDWRMRLDEALMLYEAATGSTPEAHS